MPGYAIKIETLEVGGLDMHVRSLLDRQQFSDPLGEAERAGISSATWPLFGLPWPSGYVLAGVMSTLELRSRRILEVGCGLGLASLVVQRRLGNITASDCHPLAKSFLAENLRLNDLPAMKFTTGDWCGPNPSLGQFDLIIGSDVLYERGLPKILSEFIERHSCAIMDVIIVDPDRGNRSAFNKCMDVLGFERSEVRLTQLPLTHEAIAVPYKGRILSYKRGERVTVF